MNSQAMIVSTVPLPSLFMAELADEQTTHDGLILVDNPYFQEAQLIPVRDDYAELWKRHEAALDEIEQLRAGIRTFLNLQIGCNRARLYELVGLDVPGQKRDTEVGT
jgi:hypothetical protein